MLASPFSPPISYTTRYLCCEEVAAVVSVPSRLTGDQWDVLLSAFRERAVADAEQRRHAHVWNLEIDSQRSHAGVFWHEELASSQGSSYLLMPLAECSDEALDTCELHIRREGDVVRVQSLRPTQFIHEEAARLVARALLPAIPPVPSLKKEERERENVALPHQRGAQRLFAAHYPTGIVYADTWIDVSNDYKGLGYLNYEGLYFDWYKGAATAPKELLAEVVSHVEGIRARLGEDYPIAGNMSVVLGGRYILPSPSILNVAAQAVPAKVR
jgi:hypothetical protein